MTSSNAPTDASLLPPELLASIARQCDATIESVVSRAGGGASRSGAEVVLRSGNGDVARTYLSFDDRTSDARRLERYERERAIVMALSGELAGAGVRVPRFLASEASHLALLTELVPGNAKFVGFADAAEKDQVARAFMGHLARLHAIDASSLKLPGFGDPAVAPSTRIRRQLAELRQRNLAASPDAVLLMAIDWAERNVPPDDGPSAIVHGDAGPGNFMHDGGEITALIDWEMAHFGDPAEDLAQIWVRGLFQPSIAPADMLRFYAIEGGRDIALSRIRYHRLLFQLSFTVDRQASMDGCGPPPGNIGTNMLYHTIHMRIIVEQLAEMSGMVLPHVPLPASPEPPTALGFDIALADLRDVIVPRASDEQAAVKAKSLARMVKYWRARDRLGAIYDRCEVAEVAAELGEDFAGVVAARRALAEAVLSGRTSWESALRLCHARVMRETELMGDALGSLKFRTYTPVNREPR